MAASTIAFDIEVAGFPWEEVDLATRAYLLARARDDEARAALPQRTGLVPGLGRVVAIGLWSIEAERGLVLLDGQHTPRRPFERMPGTEVFRGSERELLAELWELVLRRRPKLVSFNGRGFDGPMLAIRSAQLGLVPSANLVPSRYDLSRHCDLMDVLSFQGALRERYTLDFWCRRFDVASPKGDLDGSQIAGAFAAGRIDDIGEYCLRDARATAELYGKLAATLLAPPAPSVDE